MKWLLCTTALTLLAGSAMAATPTKSTSDSSSTEKSHSATTGNSTQLSVSKTDSYGKSVADMNEARSYINAWSRAWTSIHKGNEKSRASVDIHDKAYAKKDADGDFYAASSGTAAATGKNNKGKKATEFSGAEASAQGGKQPAAAASAHTGKEKVTARAASGIGVSGSGGKQIILHKNGETIVVEYTAHTEAVGIEDKHHAEAYAAVAARGVVYTGKTLIEAATAAAYAFAEGWAHGAYAAALSGGHAYGSAGKGQSWATAAGEAEAVVYDKGHLIKIVLPAVPKIIHGVSAGDPPDPPDPGLQITRVTWCWTHHDASGWYAACSAKP